MPNLSSLVVSDDRLFRYFLSEQHTFSIKSLAVTTQSGNPFSLLNLVQRKMATTWIHKFWKSLGLPLEKFPDCAQRLNDVIIKGKGKGNSSCLNEQHAQKCDKWNKECTAFKYDPCTGFGNREVIFHGQNTVKELCSWLFSKQHISMLPSLHIILEHTMHISYTIFYLCKVLLPK